MPRTSKVTPFPPTPKAEKLNPHSGRVTVKVEVNGSEETSVYEIRALLGSLSKAEFNPQHLDKMIEKMLKDRFGRDVHDISRGG